MWKNTVNRDCGQLRPIFPGRAVSCTDEMQAIAVNPGNEMRILWPRGGPQPAPHWRKIAGLLDIRAAINPNGIQ